MTTFQSVVYAVIHGISELLPLSSKTHYLLTSYLLGWQPPTDALLGAFALGSFLALMVYFRHDWASMISSFLQILIYRKRPMTLDERLPLFLVVSSIPIAIASSYFRDSFAKFEGVLIVALLFAAFGIPLWIFDSMSRKSKGTVDWNWLDAIIVGFVQAAAILPGWDHLSGILLGALLLNYRREAAAKYAYFAATPLLAVQAIHHLKGVSFGDPMPMPELSWLSFIVSIVVTLLVGLLIIGGFMKHVQQKGLGQYIIYRWILALAVCVSYWFRTRAM